MRLVLSLALVVLVVPLLSLVHLLPMLVAEAGELITELLVLEVLVEEEQVRVVLRHLLVQQVHQTSEEAEVEAVEQAVLEVEAVLV
jgi:hypothetical protein